MEFQYCDCTGARISPEQLRALDISTPVMEHVYASVLARREPPAPPPEPRTAVEAAGNP